MTQFWLDRIAAILEAKAVDLRENAWGEGVDGWLDDFAQELRAGRIQAPE